MCYNVNYFVSQPVGLDFTSGSGFCQWVWILPEGLDSLMYHVIYTQPWHKMVELSLHWRSTSQTLEAMSWVVKDSCRGQVEEVCRIQWLSKGNIVLLRWLESKFSVFSMWPLGRTGVQRHFYSIHNILDRIIYTCMKTCYTYSKHKVPPVHKQ